MKISLNSILSGFHLTKLNDNFQKIQDELNNKVLYRDNPLGEPNAVASDVDMNGKVLYNLPTPVLPSQAARLQDILNSQSGLNVANFTIFSPYKNVTSTTVQGAIQEIKDDVDAIVVNTNVIHTGTGAISRTVQDVFRERLSVKDYGALGDGVADDTASITLALAQGIITKRKVFFPAGIYLVTSSLPFIQGTQIYGELGAAYDNGFDIPPLATTINFRPTVANSDLFVASGVNEAGFRLNYSVEGLYINGNANARYALDLDHVIYSKFESLAIDDFQYPIRCNGTINNRFCNIYATGTSASVVYAGNSETTDVWEQPTFFGSPIGVKFLGSSINIRFNNPLFEQCDTYGMQIAKECQNIQVIGGYGEDAPFTNVGTNAMFQVGYVGTTLISEIQLTVIGGKYSGRNAGSVGSFIDTDYTNGVVLTDVVHSRFINIIKTTANTRNDSIITNGCTGIGWSTYATDMTKVVGSYPSSVNNSGSASQVARYTSVVADTLTAKDGGGTSINMTGGALQFAIGAANAAWPIGDNTKAFGIASNRWSVIYAGTATISTSDARTKQQKQSIDPAVLRAWAKVNFCQFKFNDSVAVKGGGARWHVGVIAQEVKAAFESEGLDAFSYGLLCYDEWEADDTQPAGNRYGIRYEEALALECAYLRSKLI